MITHKLLAKYIFKETSVKEIKKVEKWLNESEANPIELHLLKERIEKATFRYRPNTFVATRALEKIRQSVRKPVSLFTRLFRYSAAAILLFIVGSSLLYYFYSRPVSFCTLRSKTDQILVCYLPDSTQVTLAGASELRYPTVFTGKLREVSMKGKIFFKVHHRTSQPFKVTTPSIDITVLGTVFQVESEKQQAKVLVKQGKVAVASPHQEKSDTLTAGMSLQWWAQNDQVVTANTFDQNMLAWKTKQLQFHNTPLLKVIETLNDYYKVDIILPESYRHLRLTATFKDIPLSKALEIINLTLDIQLNNPDK